MTSKSPGVLSPEELSSGISACLDNSLSLYEDAELLLRADRPARALTCLLTSGQEMGKVNVLLSMASISPENESLWAKGWQKFYSHRYKAASGFMGVFPSMHDPEGTLDYEFAIGIQFANQKAGPAAEEWRQESLYVGFLDGTREWASPLTITRQSLNRLKSSTKINLMILLDNRDKGLFSPRALEIRREVFSDLVCRTPPKGEPDFSETVRMVGEARGLYAQYERRLKEEGYDITDVVGSES